MNFMLTKKDIENLTYYLIDVMKDHFMTKEDGKILHEQIHKLQTTMDGVVKLVKNHDEEIVIHNHKLKEIDNFLVKAGPKIKLEYKP